jgi:hypothetical protein
VSCCQFPLMRVFVTLGGSGSISVEQVPHPLAVLVGIQAPDDDDVAHEASLEELGRPVKTLGYDVIGTVSQKREVAEDQSAMPASSSPGPLVALQRIRAGADLGSQMPKHRWGEVGFLGPRHRTPRIARFAVRTGNMVRLRSQATQRTRDAAA